VTTDNRLVGIIHGAFTADLPTCIVKFNTVAHPGGDDADEHAVIGDVTKRNRPGSGFVPIGPEGWLRRYLLALVVSTATGFRPTRRAQDAVAALRHFTARFCEWVSRVTSKPVYEISDHGLMDRVRRRIGDKRVLANVESKLIAPAIFSRRSASRFAGCFAGCIGTFERRQRSRIDLSGSSVGDDRPLTRCPVAAPFALCRPPDGRPPRGD